MFVMPRSREAVAPQAPGRYEHRHPRDPRAEGETSPLRNSHQYESMRIAVEAGIALEGPRDGAVGWFGRAASFPFGKLFLRRIIARMTGTGCITRGGIVLHDAPIPVIVARWRESRPAASPADG